MILGCGDLGSQSTMYPGIPGMILGCPMLGDHGSELGILGYQEQSWDIRDDRYPGMSHATVRSDDPEILSILG